MEIFLQLVPSWKNPGNALAFAYATVFSAIGKGLRTMASDGPLYNGPADNEHRNFGEKGCINCDIFLSKVVTCYALAVEIISSEQSEYV